MASRPEGLDFGKEQAVLVACSTQVGALARVGLPCSRHGGGNHQGLRNRGCIR